MLRLKILKLKYNYRCIIKKLNGALIQKGLTPFLYGLIKLANRNPLIFNNRARATSSVISVSLREIQESLLGKILTL